MTLLVLTAAQFSVDSSSPPRQFTLTAHLNIRDFTQSRVLKYEGHLNMVVKTELPNNITVRIYKGIELTIHFHFTKCKCTMY